MSDLKNILLSKINCKSVWFMRQAGRYLPEFRKIRAQNKNFIQLCLDSELSSELTLQPIKRFDLDSAIIFSDILLVPHALGQSVNFRENYGPSLGSFNSNLFADINVDKFTNKLMPVYKAIEITRKKLNKQKSLISFIGAPWTLLVYMLGLKIGKEEINLDRLNKKSIRLNEIINELVKYLCVHIQNQINAGADVVQIFDSWAGFIPKEKITNYCYKPNKDIVDFCKKRTIPTICFPKGIGKKYQEYNEIVNPDGINLDYDIDPNWAKDKLKNVVIQGGLNPKVLLHPQDEMINTATKYIKNFKDIPYVFNLGHGLLPETDPDNVDKLVKFYRNFNG